MYRNQRADGAKATFNAVFDEIINEPAQTVEEAVAIAHVAAENYLLDTPETVEPGVEGA